jgi:hypothetical protein
LVSPEIDKKLELLLEPNAGEVVRAKEAVLAAARDGRARAAADLEWVLVDAEGLDRHAPSNAQIDITPVGGISREIDGSDPLIAAKRLHIATRFALAELENEGLLVGVDGPANVYVQIPMRYGGQSGGSHVAVGMPTLSSGYQIARRFNTDVLTLLDFDIFTSALSSDLLDDRGRLCIREALSAYRHELYLSCVNLLGAVSEGAWWKLAEKLRGKSSTLDSAVGSDRTSISLLIRLTADEISKLKNMKSAAAELYAHATYLRELRNYGAHPKGADPEATEEHAFTEAGCALLLLSTHRYLEKLGAVLAKLPVST